MLLILLLMLFGCEKIVLKKGDKVPFKISKGTYTFNVKKLEYPLEIEAKEIFLEEIEQALSSIIVDGRKVIIMLNEEFIKDFSNLEKDGLLNSENSLNKSASILSVEDKKELFDLLKIENNNYKDQDILSLQIKYILRLLNREEEFNDKKIYTELYKERALESLQKKRNRVIKILKNRDIELLIEMDTIYSSLSDKSYDYKKYYYTKDISSEKGNKFANSIKEYEKNAIIVIKDMKEKDFNRVISSEVSLNSKNYILNNDKYKGYLNVDGSLIYLIGGEQDVFSNYGYKVFVDVKNSTIEDLNSSNEKYIISDLFKSKDEIKKENEERDIINRK